MKMSHVLLFTALLSTASSRGSAPARQVPATLVFTATQAGLSVPPAARSGYTHLALKNDSKQMMAHAVARLRDGVPITEGVRAVHVLRDLEKGDKVTALARFDGWYGGAIFVPPGAQKSVGTTLKPGRYVTYADTITDQGPQVKAPFIKTFTVNPTPNEAGAPTPTYTVDMRDFRLEMPRQVKAGKTVWRIRNVGKALHFTFIGKLKPGTTHEDVKKWMFGDGEDPGDPRLPTIGVHTLSAGLYNDVELDLRPGLYGAVCFIDNHHMAGMWEMFTVVK